MTKKPAWSILRYCALLVIGNAMFALGFNLFLVPNSLNVGGLSGIAMILQRVLGKGGIGLYTAVMNVPLFVIGYRRLGRGFFFGSLLGMACNSLLIDLLAGLPAPQVETMLGVIFGGVLTGAGLGLVFLPGATTGGTDMAARMIHNRFQHISVGAILFLIDCCVVLMAGFFIEAEYALYAFASLYASSRLIDVVMVGLAREKACYIISTQHERVKQEIMQKLDRGVTVLRAEGGYSGQERPVLLCVLRAQEMGRLKAIVREADEDAFLFISDAHEVLGEGFRRLME